jgi:hypothetical protein
MIMLLKLCINYIVNLHFVPFRIRLYVIDMVKRSITSRRSGRRGQGTQTPSSKSHHTSKAVRKRAKEGETVRDSISALRCAPNKNTEHSAYERQ